MGRGKDAENALVRAIGLIVLQLLGEEPDDLGVERPVKRRAVEVCRRVGADARHRGGELGRAGRKEGEVCSRDRMNLGTAWKARGHTRGPLRIDAVAAQL